MNTIIVYLACIIFIFIIGKFLPLKSIIKILGNSILGGILIFIINSVGSLWNFHIGLNVGTSLITGILGIPRSNIINYIKNIYGLRRKMPKNKGILYTIFFIKHSILAYIFNRNKMRGYFLCNIQKT